MKFIPHLIEARVNTYLTEKDFYRELLSTNRARKWSAIGIIG